jgi:hypothetical protein
MEHAAVEQRADRVHGVVEVGVALALDRRRPARGVDQPEHDAQRGRLAGPVRTQEADDVPLLDGEREVVDGECLAKPLREPCDLDCRHVAAGP